VRVVLDTDIIVSAILSAKGAARALLDLARGGQIEIVTSSILLDELEDVLARFFPPAAASEIRVAIEEIAYLVEPAEVPAVTRDPDDDQVPAAAIAGDSVYIISRDADLLVLGEYEGVRILEPAAALRAVRAASGDQER
jgi:putative PIN family toxin of toxin-antitoxin system